MWDLPSCQRFATLTGHESYLTALAFSPDGRRLASASADTTVLLWDVEQARLDCIVAECAAHATRLRECARLEGRIRRLIRGLDDDDFDVREKASEELETLGAEALFYLQQAAKAGPSLEVKMRARRLLARIDAKAMPKVLSRDRVPATVGLLVGLGPHGKRALEELAKLDGQTLVAEEARRALAAMRTRD